MSHSLPTIELDDHVHILLCSLLIAVSWFGYDFQYLHVLSYCRHVYATKTCWCCTCLTIAMVRCWDWACREPMIVHSNPFCVLLTHDYRDLSLLTWEPGLAFNSPMSVVFHDHISECTWEQSSLGTQILHFSAYPVACDERSIYFA